MDVVGQEADADAEDQHGQEGTGVALEEDAGVAESHRVEQEGGGGDAHDARRQPVEAVDEVDGVGDEHDPHHGEQRRQIR